jgi:siroheme synthase (precorrin-2 oxidase/ferrochelatase)
MKLDRRHFLAATGALAAGTAIAQADQPAALLHQHPEQMPLLPPVKGKRVVVCGGGWGGVSAAKHLKQNDPNLDVVMLERNPVFFSCPMSNKWLVDVVDTDYLTYSYLKTAEQVRLHASSRPKSPASSATRNACSRRRASSTTTT